jgi:ubiquinol-cytochrome c reductase cytochrome b subunit
MKIGDWLEERMGWRGLLDSMLNEPIAGRSRWRYVLGSGLLFTFVLQAVTGITLAMYYSPSATDAWGSVWYIETQVAFGSIVRGLHHFGSSAMVVLSVLHMVQVFLHGAHKRPRELNWVVGTVMLFVVLGFSLTGYLLPWDQKGYWATRVATGIMGTMPLVGEATQIVAQGGTDYGSLTLTRFYALHVLVLPGALMGLIVAHLYLFRRHGVTPSPTSSETERAAVEMFWPVQVFKDLVFAATVLGILLALAMHFGAPLDSPADPASNYEARPEWYFLFLFQLLKYFEGPMAILGTVVLPTAGAVFLLALPLLDRTPPERSALRNPWAIGFFGLLVGAGALTGLAFYEDSTNAKFTAAVATQATHQKRALEMAADGGVDVYGKIPAFEGFLLFDEKGCTGCHSVPGHAPPEEPHGPALKGYLSRAHFESFLRDPLSETHFGGRDVAKGTEWDMPAIASEEIAMASDDTVAAVVEFLAAQSGIVHDPPIDSILAERGKALILDGACSDCHEIKPEESDGPALGGYGSKTWLKAFLHAPGDGRFFGDRNAMPAAEDLDSRQINYLVSYLHRLSR